VASVSDLQSFTKLRLRFGYLWEFLMLVTPDEVRFGGLGKAQLLTAQALPRAVFISFGHIHQRPVTLTSLPCATRVLQRGLHSMAESLLAYSQTLQDRCLAPNILFNVCRHHFPSVKHSTPLRNFLDNRLSRAVLEGQPYQHLILQADKSASVVQ
jgi:hypothetical protein